MKIAGNPVDSGRASQDAGLAAVNLAQLLIDTTTVLLRILGSQPAPIALLLPLTRGASLNSAMPRLAGDDAPAGRVHAHQRRRGMNAFRSRSNMPCQRRLS
ncbi:MAG: hypothetical protein AB7V26_12215 [Lysobacterales bacterium]